MQGGCQADCDLRGGACAPAHTGASACKFYSVAGLSRLTQRATRNSGRPLQMQEKGFQFVGADPNSQLPFGSEHGCASSVCSLAMVPGRSHAWYPVAMSVLHTGHHPRNHQTGIALPCAMPAPGIAQPARSQKGLWSDN
eukprot:1056159-Rhodomonas_salina.2